MRRHPLVLVMVVGLLAAPACGRGGQDDNAFRLELDGRALVGDRTVSAGAHDVSDGDTVTMIEGDAVLELPGDRSMLLRAVDGDADPTVVDVSIVPDVVAGDAVVVAGEDGARFRAGNVDVQVTDGAARVHRGLSVTVAMYRGSAEVRSAGRTFDGGLHALRQLSIAATGLLPREALPLVYDERNPDPWDQRFIGDAIDLGTELDGRARGFTGQLGPGASVDAGLLRRVLPPLEEEGELDSLVSDDSSPGEALVGASIVVESAGGSFAARWNDVFSFREAGARWGLVALDQRVKRDALLARINDAFGRSPFLFAAGPGPTASGGGTGTGGGGTTTTAPAPGGGTTTTTTTEGGDDPIVTIPPITVPPTTVPSPRQDDSGEEDASLVDDILDNVLGDDEEASGPRRQRGDARPSSQSAIAAVPGHTAAAVPSLGCRNPCNPTRSRAKTSL